MSIIVCAVLIVGITSCEDYMFDKEYISNQDNNSGIAGGFFSDSGCDLYINGSFENGASELDAFSNFEVDYWGGAFGTADRKKEHEGIMPYSGDYLAHMQRYRGTSDHYESIYYKGDLKAKNEYDLSYFFRGNTLSMEVYIFDEIEPINLNSLIPSYANDLGNPGFSLINSGPAISNSWNQESVNFTNQSGKLVFIPASSPNNENKMILDKVSLICKYGYLENILANIIETTQYGYIYKFSPIISEYNPSLSYLWTFNYLNGGHSSALKFPNASFPFPPNKPYKVEACLEITDIDGCCTEECIEFEIGSEVDTPPPPADSICNYSICLDTWLTSCEENFVYVETDNGWEFITFYEAYNIKVILDKIVNSQITDAGYEPVKTKEIPKGGCKHLYVVECSPIPISIPYICLAESPDHEEIDEEQIKTVIFESDCTVDCEE